MAVENSYRRKFTAIEKPAVETYNHWKFIPVENSQKINLLKIWNVENLYPWKKIPVEKSTVERSSIENLSIDKVEKEKT